MNRKQFVLDSKALKIKEVLNKDFLEIEILSIAEGENRNQTSFTLESMKKSIPTFYNKFILGYFTAPGGVNNEGHFEEHNSDVKYDEECQEFYYSYLAPNAEKALGIIRESDKVEIVEIDGKKWIKLTAAILTKYNREAVKHLLKSRNKKKVSVEITIEKYHTVDGIDIIDEFTLDGITILGTRRNSNKPCQEGIEGASMILKFLQSEVYSTQKRALSFAYQELEQEELNENEEQEEITMKNNEINIKEEERGTIPMLTYEQKRSLLEAKLNEILCKKEDGEECCCYCWVCDLDDTHVYYHYNDTYYKATYSINEEDSSVEISTGEAVQVTRSWQEFAVEEEVSEVQEDAQESVGTEAFSAEENDAEEIQDNKENFVAEEDEADKKEECSEEETKDSDGEAEKEDIKPDDKEQECGTQCAVEEHEEACGTQCSNEEKQEQECGTQCSESNEEIDGEVYEEKGNPDEDEKTDETTEDDDDNEEKEEYIDGVNVYNDYSLEIKQYGENEDVIEVAFKATEDNYAQFNEAYNNIVEVVSKLQADYNELESKYNDIISAQQNATLYSYGEELFNAEEDLEEDNCKALIADFKSKCDNSEFASEEDVNAYVEDQIAKMIYKQIKNNKEKNNEQKNFSAKLKSTNAVETQEVAKDSMAKMKEILKY